MTPCCERLAAAAAASRAGEEMTQARARNGSGTRREQHEGVAPIGGARLLLSIALVLISVLAHADDREEDRARDCVEFGIRVARAGLWSEAAFQFERATRLDPTYAAAFNNLAVAYEQLGRLAEARQLYAHAL